MEILDRIKIAVKALISLGVAKNQEELGKMLGYKTKSGISQVLNAKVPLPVDFVDRLCKLDKRLVKMWIINEEGSVLRGKEQSKQVYIDNNILLSEVNEDLSCYKSKNLPLLPIEAMAGNGGGGVSILEYDVQQKYVVPEFNDADFMIPVKGSSMYPKYNSGDVIACKIILERSFFQWGRVFVLHHKEQGTMVKRIFPTETETFIECKSDNPSYPPFRINLDEVTNIALVIGVIRLE